jgi:hypothetical protein
VGAARDARLELIGVRTLEEALAFALG